MVKSTSNRLLGWIGFASLGLAIPAFGWDLCKVGDGPTALNFIGSTSAKQRTIGTGGLSEFMIWEKAGFAVHRGANQKVIATRLFDEKAWHLTNLTSALSNLVDPGEKYLLGSEEALFFDAAKQKKWIRFSQQRDLKHLFWNDDSLYSMRPYFPTPDVQILDIYQYKAGGDYSVKVCGDKLKFPKEKGYAIGSGHHYPYVFLYQTKQEPLFAAGQPVYEVTGYELNIETCKIQKKTLARHVEGVVEGAHWFENEQAVAVKARHAEKSLMWDAGQGDCRFYNLGGIDSRILPLNGKQPVLASWNGEKGRMELVHLNEGKVGSFLEGMDFDALAAQDLFLTSDARYLYVSPKFKGQKEKSLVEIRLEDF